MECTTHLPTFRLAVLTGAVHYSTPRVFVDLEGRILAVLAAQPNNNTWDKVLDEIPKVLARAATQLPSDSKSNRGNHLLVNTGVSFGGGQLVSEPPLQMANCVSHILQAPQNLKVDEAVMAPVLANNSVKRVAGFQSCKCYVSHTRWAIT